VEDAVVLLIEANEVDGDVVVEVAVDVEALEVDTRMRMVVLIFVLADLAYKDREEVLRNTERDTSEARPPRGRGGRGGGGGGRGRQFDRHSASGRTYNFKNVLLIVGILRRQPNKLGVTNRLPGNQLNLSLKLIVKQRRRMLTNLRRLLKKTLQTAQSSK
jgi:hypothetical protein